MDNEILQFAKDKLFIEGYFEEMAKEYILKEEDKQGKSTLDVICNSECNLCISNLDSNEKNVYLSFFRSEKKLGLRKRVDHVILEQVQNGRWNAHLIEMKTGIEDEAKWIDIKGKFRASYLIIRAIAAILHIEIEQFYFYTTYEHANFPKEESNIKSRRAKLGEKIVKAKDEWESGFFDMNLGEKRSFKHLPVHMEKKDGILQGNLNLIMK